MLKTEGKQVRGSLTVVPGSRPSPDSRKVSPGSHGFLYILHFRVRGKPAYVALRVVSRLLHIMLHPLELPSTGVELDDLEKLQMAVLLRVLHAGEAETY